MTALPPNSPVVIYVNGSSSGHDGTEPAGHHSGPLSGNFPHTAHAELLSRGRPYDPHKVHREFPERWQAYIRASYRNIGHVCQVFQVSERTARKWWAGETGAVGGHVAIAINEHPQDAPRMLFAPE